QIGSLDESPCDRVGIRDGDDVVRCAFDRQIRDDGVVGLDVVDGPAEVGVGAVGRDVVGAVGEGAGGGEVAEAAGFGSVDLRVEGGLHVVGGKHEVDVAPESFAPLGSCD